MLEFVVGLAIAHAVLGLGVGYDAMGRNAPETVWLVIVLLSGVLGVLLYYAVVMYE